MSGQRSSVSHKHMGAETVELLSADALHLPKLLHAVERATFITMLNHPLGQLRTDSREGL